MSGRGQSCEKLTTERVKTELEKEREYLLQLRQVVEGQLKVLKAEEVTIKRLIHFQTDSAQGESGSHSHSMPHSHSNDSESDSAIELAQEPGVGNRLPHLDLDVSCLPSTSARNADLSEEETDTDMERDD